MTNKNAALALLFPLLAALSCVGEDLPFESPDGGAGSGGGTGGGAGQGTPGVCAAYANYPESQDGKSCTTAGTLSDGCQACQCLSTGVQRCSEYICQQEACPTRLPPEGMPCDGAPCDCRYPTQCGTDNVATCDAGRWVIAPAGCTPECPATPPTRLTPCWDKWLRCDYDQPGCAPLHASCLGGGAAGAGNDEPTVGNVWNTMVPACDYFGPVGPGAGLCPIAPPSPAQSCNQTELHCYYPNGCAGVTESHCDGSQWAVQDHGCGLDCPAERPRTGDSCQTPMLVGPPCSYAEGTSCETDCVCMRDNRWACYDLCFNSDGQLMGDSMQPGGMPDPWHSCLQGAWCDAVGATCNSAVSSCTCTTQGWACVSH